MKVITFGRNGNNDVIINDQYVGRNHCQIVENEGKFMVIDLNSTNGTYVNGSRITGQHPLSSSDEVRIGQTVLNWQEYFTQPTAPVDPQVPIDAPAKENKSKSKTIIMICVALLIAIGGLVAYFVLQPYTKHASALPRNMVALMSVNMRTLQKQAEINQNDLSRLVAKIEREAFNNRVDVDNSGIKLTAPIYAFVEDIDVRGENGSFGIVLPISNEQQFANFLLNLLNDRSIVLNKYNDIQYLSQDNIFIGFNQSTCLYYASSYLNSYQIENRGFELLSQDVSQSGKKSKLFSLLSNNPISCTISGEECERVLNGVGEFRDLMSSMGIELSNSYLAMQLKAQKDGLEISLNNVDDKAMSQNSIFGTIKGTKLSDFSTEDIAFAAINVNGYNLLREVFAALPSNARTEVSQFFEECNRELIDIESIIRAINGDMYLSVQDWPFNNNARRNREPKFVFMAEMPSSGALNNSVLSVRNMVANNYDLRSVMGSIDSDGSYLRVQSENTYQVRSHTSQQQYQKDINNKFLYISVNANPIIDELEGNRDFRELMPYARYLKRVSTSASNTDISLKLELTNTWQSILNNF